MRLCAVWIRVLSAAGLKIRCERESCVKKKFTSTWLPESSWLLFWSSCLQILLCSRKWNQISVWISHSVLCLRQKYLYLVQTGMGKLIAILIGFSLNLWAALNAKRPKTVHKCSVHQNCLRYAPPKPTAAAASPTRIAVDISLFKCALFRWFSPKEWMTQSSRFKLPD